MSAPIGVVGGGAFGMALAHACARAGHQVNVWSRSNKARKLNRNVAERIRIVSRIGELGASELIFFAVPSTHIESVAYSLGEHLDGRHVLVHVSRGLVGDDLMTISHVLRSQTPARKVGVLAGPLTAAVLRDGAPGGAVIGTAFPEVAHQVKDAFTERSLRLYVTDDVIGVEVATAIVGLMALVAGYADGIGVGPGTKALLLTRGIAEGARVGVSLGGNERSFFGLAGFGDLLAAIAGDDRPEVLLGGALARGENLDKAAKEVGAYIEGVTIAQRVADYANRVGIAAPIANVVAKLIAGTISKDDAIAHLMSRQIMTE